MSNGGFNEEPLYLDCLELAPSSYDIKKLPDELGMSLARTISGTVDVSRYNVL